MEIQNAQKGKNLMASQFCVTPPTNSIDLPEFLYWDGDDNIFKVQQEAREKQFVSKFLPYVDVDGSYEEELTQISTDFNDNIHSLDNHQFYFLRVEHMHASFYEDDEASFADPRYLRSSLEVYEFAFRNERWSGNVLVYVYYDFLM
uniref:Uncharacterized protein n=1 Tax=Ditylenchus dipsaci TaxID=166011 RepID=A0A915DC93_9BILA